MASRPTGSFRGGRWAIHFLIRVRQHKCTQQLELSTTPPSTRLHTGSWCLDQPDPPARVPHRRPHCRQAERPKKRKPPEKRQPSERKTQFHPQQEQTQAAPNRLRRRGPADTQSLASGGFQLRLIHLQALKTLDNDRTVQHRNASLNNHHRRVLNYF